MSAEEGTAPRVAIGISFGNSYSSIAHTSGVCISMQPFALNAANMLFYRMVKRKLSPTKTEVSQRKATIVDVYPSNIDVDRQIPSILSYVEGEEFHGGQAKSQLIRNPKNTVTSFRDFLGKEYA